MTFSYNTTIIMQFQELTDNKQWQLFRTSLPSPAYTGRPRANDRMMTLNGILYVLMSGCRWMMDICLPSMVPPTRLLLLLPTVWERHKKKWSEQEGVWKRIMGSMVSHGYHHTGLLVDDANELSVDSSTVAAKKGGKRLATMTATTRRRREARYM
jgi:transposase